MLMVRWGYLPSCEVRHELIHLFAVRNKELEQNICLFAINDLASRMACLVSEVANYGKDAREVSIEVLVNF